MIHGRRLYAIVPARGGSKGIPRKNLYKINGVTLVELAIRLAKACARVDTVYVSTDDPEIHAIAATYGCATPSLRPVELATDAARTTDVIRHLVETGVLGANDCIMLLQPTTPLRTRVDINAVCDLLESRWQEADAVVSVCAIDGPHPYKAQMICDGYLRSLFDRDSSVARQSLPPTYIPNGAFYFGKLAVLDVEDTFIPARSLPYVMSAMTSVNLDGPLDIVLLEALLEKGMVRLDVSN